MVPKLRFKEFCGEWEEKRLGDVCKINPKNESLPDTFNYIDLENVVEGRLLKFNNTISKNNAPSRAKRLLQNNDILYQTVRPYQKNNFYFDIEETEIPYVASTGYSQLRTDKNNPKFIFQEIHTDIFVNNVLERCTGTSYPAINSSDLGNIRFTIPSLPEQTKIADFLSTVDDKIQNQEDKITHLENIKKGFMQKIFSRKIRFKDDSGEDFPEWEEKKIKDVFKITRGYVLSANNVEKNINKEYIYPVYSSQTKDKGLLGYYNEYLYEDAITWTTDGANAGTVHFRRGKFYCTNVCGVLISENGYANKCIAEMINRISKKYVSYVGNPKLMNNIMAEIKIDLPCLKEQQKISDILSLLDEKIDTDKETLEHLKQLKKGLLQQMFA